MHKHATSHSNILLHLKKYYYRLRHKCNKMSKKYKDCALREIFQVLYIILDRKILTNECNVFPLISSCILSTY